MNNKQHNGVPNISVVIPLYNKAMHIEHTLQSILKQSFAASEIIVVDDGSTDDGAARVELFPQVKLIRQFNAGVSAARNRGIEQASGEYVAFIDADDEWLPHFLEEIVMLTKTFPKAGLYGTAYQFRYNKECYRDPKIRFKKDQPIIGLLEDYFDIGTKGNLPFMMSSVVARKAALKHIGFFVEGDAMGEDQGFFSRAALHSTIAYSRRVMAIYDLCTTERACLTYIPKAPCRFSIELYNKANTSEYGDTAGTLKNYCAAHVLHLVSLNVSAGRLKTAAVLLKHKLTKRLPTRRIWWQCRLSLALAVFGFKLAKLRLKRRLQRTFKRCKKCLDGGVSQ